jgi:hypothetical protein
MPTFSRTTSARQPNKPRASYSVVLRVIPLDVVMTVASLFVGEFGQQVFATFASAVASDLSDTPTSYGLNTGSGLPPCSGASAK